MKHESAFSSIALFEVVLGVIRANTEVLFRTEAIKKKDLSKVETLVEDSLFIQLQASLQELCDETAERDNDLAIVSILDAFTALGLDREKAREIQNSTQTIRNGETEASIDVTNRLNVFLASQTTEDLDNELGGTDCSSIHGRLSIREQTRSAMSADKDGKMRLVTSILSGSTVSSLQLGQLLAVRQIILSVDGKYTPMGVPLLYADSQKTPEDLNVARTAIVIAVMKTKSPLICLKHIPSFVVSCKRQKVFVSSVSSAKRWR